MNITAASNLIASYLNAGQINFDTAVAAQAAIRGLRYGNRMSGRDRRDVLALRFGIVDTATPVAALLARSAAVEA